MKKSAVNVGWNGVALTLNLCGTMHLHLGFGILFKLTKEKVGVVDSQFTTYSFLQASTSVSDKAVREAATSNPIFCRRPWFVHLQHFRLPNFLLACRAASP
jgi:hypothetical protein